MSESLPKQRNYQVTIPDLTWEEAVEMVESAAGGSTLFSDQDGKPFNPSCAPYPVVYAYPRDKQASIALMGYDQSRCAELEAELSVAKGSAHEWRSHAARLDDKYTSAMREARSLAKSLWRRYYREESPTFELCDSAAGIITQIDNMVAGITESNANLKAEIAALREREARLKLAGGLLANVAYNLKQSDAVGDYHRRALEKAQEHWDDVTKVQPHQPAQSEATE